ncbi:MAG: hypothetical protein ACK6CT_09770 [Planctomycetia bacterium]
MAVQLQCIRALKSQERLRKGCALTNRGRRSSKEAIRRRHPGAMEDKSRLQFLAIAYGDAVAEDVRRWLQERAADGGDSPMVICMAAA